VQGFEKSTSSSFELIGSSRFERFLVQSSNVVAPLPTAAVGSCKRMTNHAASAGQVGIGGPFAWVREDMHQGGVHILRALCNSGLALVNCKRERLHGREVMWTLRQRFCCGSAAWRKHVVI